MNAKIQKNVIASPIVSENEVLSKVIVVEKNAERLTLLKSFFETNKLLGYRVNRKNILSILKSNIDLGGVFLPEVDNQATSFIDLALSIHKIRPDLPIFMSVESDRSLKNLSAEAQEAIVGTYLHSDLSQLKELVDTYLFSRHYPSEFISSVRELSAEILQNSFKEMSVNVEHPYIVKDKVVYGELFSLFPLETNWCRGYMMLQMEEGNIMEAVTAQKTLINTAEPNFRHVNAILGELSNMIWGGLKNRYGSKSHEESLGQVRTEIPIIVNHLRKYISFGSDDPQLCLKYKLLDKAGILKPITIYQKFIFSLDWSPEKYAEANKNMNDLVSGGELELF